MLAQLKAKNAITVAGMESAFLKTHREAFIQAKYHLLAYESLPVPFLETKGSVYPLPSPHLTAIILQLLDLEPAADVLISGAEGGYLAALVDEMVKGGRVEVLEGDGERAEAVRTGLRLTGHDEVTVSEKPTRREWDRIVSFTGNHEAGNKLKALLRDMGALIFWQTGKEGDEFVKVIRDGEGYVQLTFSEAGGTREGGMEPVNLRAVLSLERLQANVWRGDRPTAHDRYFGEQTDSTFEGGPWDTGSLAREVLEKATLARRVFHLAYIYQMLGDLENAERLYGRSLESYATAEAHTFLGWVHSFHNRLDVAIEECKMAIQVDPSFGNPYNDIGAYLIQKGQLEDAIPWLRGALKSTRYCCYFYAHCNLGRVYMLLDDLEAARDQFQQALDVNPEYELAHQLLREVEGQMRSARLGS